MENEQLTVTIGLNRYNKLRDIEKAVYEGKSVYVEWTYLKDGTFYNYNEENEILVKQIKDLQAQVHKLKNEKNIEKPSFAFLGLKFYKK